MAQHAHKGTCGVHKRRTSQGEKSILTHNFYSQSCCLDKPAVWLHGSFDADVEVTPLQSSPVQSTAPPCCVCRVVISQFVRLCSRSSLSLPFKSRVPHLVRISGPLSPCHYFRPNTAMCYSDGIKTICVSRVHARVSLQVGPQRFSDPTCN